MQCKQILLNPPDGIIESTRRWVAQMANGGLEPAHGYLTAAEEQNKLNNAMKICKDVHKATIGNSIKTYNVYKNGKRNFLR